jgi:hypothetical protein
MKGLVKWFLSMKVKKTRKKQNRGLQLKLLVEVDLVQMFSERSLKMIEMNLIFGKLI